MTTKPLCDPGLAKPSEPLAASARLGSRALEPSFAGSSAIFLYHVLS
jgi:hypothetical protein